MSTSVARPRWLGTVAEAAPVDAVAVSLVVGGRVCLRLENGIERDLSVPADLRQVFRPGVRVTLYDGVGGGLLGWYAPEQGIGFDFRS
jgi:hypothetical protein